MLRAADMEVIIAPQRLRVVYKGKSGASGLGGGSGSSSTSRSMSIREEEVEERRGVVLAEGELVRSVDASNSFWWIENDGDNEESDQKEESGDVEVDVPEGVRGRCLLCLSLTKRRKSIWAGVWRAELEEAKQISRPSLAKRRARGARGEESASQAIREMLTSPGQQQQQQQQQQHSNQHCTQPPQ